MVVTKDGLRCEDLKSAAGNVCPIIARYAVESPIETGRRP